MLRNVTLLVKRERMDYKVLYFLNMYFVYARVYLQFIWLIMTFDGKV